MIIPWVQIRWISEEKGYGLFAACPIPKGTITFIQDNLDIVISPMDMENYQDNILKLIEKYSFEDFLGNRVISWDLGKYMNHDDHANTLTTGYGFEIAIRDIEKDEEVTDDYRIFSTHHDTSFSRPPGYIYETFSPLPNGLIEEWDNKVFSALLEFSKVEQPLLEYVPQEIIDSINNLLIDKTNYAKVSNSLPLRYNILNNPELFNIDL